MSRINTRILRVPGASGQIDERPMGSFMAPLEAAGEAMSQIGDVAAEIAVKEQQLRDTVLMSDLQSELQESAARAEVAAREAKTVEEIEAVRRSFTADFESIQSRSDGIKGDRNRSLFADQVSLTGGRTELGLSALQTKATVAKARMQREVEARAILQDGIATGNIDAAIQEIASRYRDGVGTLDSEWDDIEGEITNIVGAAQHLNWEMRVDEGEATAQDILSAPYLSEGARRSLLGDLASRKGRAEGIEEREFQSSISNRVQLIPDSPDSVGQSLAGLREDLNSRYGEGSPEAQIIFNDAVKSVYGELLSRAGAELLSPDGGSEPLDRLEGSVRLAERGETSGAIQKVYNGVLTGIEQVREQAVSTTRRQRAEQLKELEQGVTRAVMTAKIGGYKRADGSQMSVDEFELLMLGELGLENATPEKAWDDGEITRDNYLSIKDLILRYKSEYRELTKTPTHRLYEDALHEMSPGKIERLSQLAWLGADSDEGFEESLRSGETESVFGMVIDAASKVGFAPNHVRDWFLSKDPKEAADLWLSNGSRGFVAFDTSGLDDDTAMRLHEVSNYILAVRGGSSPESLGDFFSSQQKDRKAMFKAARDSLEKEQLRLFLRNWEHGFEAELSDEEASLTGSKSYHTGLARKLVEDGIFKDEASAIRRLTDGKAEELENAAIFILQSEGRLESFSQEDPIDVPWEVANSAYQKAAGELFAFQGGNLFSARHPGKRVEVEYSPAVAFGAVDGKSRRANSALTHAADSVWIPAFAALYDNMREEFPGAINDDVKWASLFSTENPKGADALRVLLQEANRAREVYSTEQMPGYWIDRRGLMGKSPREIRSAIASGYEELSKEQTRLGKVDLPAEAFMSSSNIRKLSSSNALRFSRGRPMESSEVAEWNAEARKLKAMGYPVEEVGFHYMLKATIETSSGPREIEFAPSPRYLVYNASLTQDAVISMRAMGPELRARKADIIATIPGNFGPEANPE